MSSVDRSRALQELQKRHAERLRQRQDAESHPNSIILRPTDIAGDYDAGRMLKTTLGGELRDITASDLRAFAKNAKTAANRFKGGVTAQSVINHSMPIDHQRANEQIKLAVPYRIKGGTVVFVTNAGPDSEDNRHIVTVDFLNMGAAVASPKRPKDIVATVSRGAIRIACDCKRWRYWYSYLATIGNYTATYRETGFPKVRNPRLSGLACKHGLRVCSNIVAGHYRSLIEKAIVKQRETLNDQAVVAVSEKQAKEFEEKRLRSVKSTLDKEKGKKLSARTPAEKKADTRMRNTAAKIAADIAKKQAANPPKRVTKRQQFAQDVETELAAFQANIDKTPGMSRAIKNATRGIAKSYSDLALAGGMSIDLLRAKLSKILSGD